MSLAPPAPAAPLPVDEALRAFAWGGPVAPEDGWSPAPTSPARLAELCRSGRPGGRLALRLTKALRPCDWAALAGWRIFRYETGSCPDEPAVLMAERPASPRALPEPSLDGQRVDLMSLPIALALRVGEQLRFNAAAASVLGQAGGYLTDVDAWCATVVAEANDALRRWIDAPTPGSEPRTFCARRPDGTIRFIDLRRLSMPPLEVWSLVDVTEGHLQRLRLRVLFEQSTNAHLIFDERGIVDCNEAAVRLLRCRDRAELLSTHPAVFSPEFQPDGRRSMEKAQEMDATARREGSHRFEWIHRRMDGTDLPVEVTLNPVLLPTGPAMLADWHDITHHLETERALSDARDRALEATRAKSAFLANMSHELRTPLNAIIGYSELIAEAGGVEAWAIPDIERVTSAGRHLLALINDILDLSKIEAGFMTLEPQWFEVAATARSVADTVTPAATANGNAVEVDVGPGVLLIYADATRLRQILLNLLGNAAKFTHDGRIGLRLSAENDAVRVDVWDTGIGMNEEEVGRIFQEFVQADPSTTRRFGGTGLGLAISRRLCVQMGGSISVTSAPGEGSTFTVTLPIGESPDDPR